MRAARMCTRAVYLRVGFERTNKLCALFVPSFQAVNLRTIEPRWSTAVLAFCGRVTLNVRKNCLFELRVRIVLHNSNYNEHRSRRTRVSLTNARFRTKNQTTRYREL